MSSAFPPIDVRITQDVAPTQEGGVISWLKWLYNRGKKRIVEAKNKIVDIAKENAASDLYSSDKNVGIADFADSEVGANVLKAGFDTAFDVLKTGAKGILSDKGEKDIKSGIKFLWEKGKQLAESDIWQGVGELLNKVWDIVGKDREESTLEFLIPDKGDRELAIQLSNFLPIPVVDDMLRNAWKLTKGTLDESFFTGLKTGAENVDAWVKTVGETITKPFQSIDARASAANLSDRILTNANRMTKGDIAKFVEAHGETPWAFLNNRGITKTWDELFDELASKAKQSKANADEAVSLIEGKYKMPEVDTIDGMEDRIATMLQDNIDKARKIGDNEGGIKNKKLFDDYMEGGLTLKEITDAQRYMQKNNKFTYFDKGSDRAQFVTNLDSDVRNWKFQVAEDNGFTNWKPINKETQAYNTMLSKMSGWAEWVTGNNPISLTDWLAFSADPKLFLAKQLVEAWWFKRNIVKGLNKIAKREWKVPLTPFDKESIIREQVKKQYGLSNSSSGNNTLEATSRSQVKQLPSGEGKTRSADVVDVQTRNVWPRGANPSDVTSRSVIKDPRIIIEGKTPPLNIAKIKLERALMNLTNNPELLNNAMKEIAIMFADGRLTPEDIDIIGEFLRKSGLYLNEAGEVVPIKLLRQPKADSIPETPPEAPTTTETIEEVVSTPEPIKDTPEVKVISLLRKKDVAEWKYDFNEVTSRYMEDITNEKPWAIAKVVDSDVLKKMFAEYDPKDPWLVHEESKILADKIFQKFLKEDKSGEVIFSAGWPASGKTEGVVSRYLDRDNIIYDHLLSSFDTFKKKYKQAIDAGKKVKVHAIYTDINTAKAYNKALWREVPDIEQKHKSFRQSLADLIKSKEYKEGNIDLQVSINTPLGNVLVDKAKITSFVRKFKDRLDI